MDLSTPSPSNRTDTLERVRAHIEAHLFEPLDAEGLAAVAGLSAYHFSRQFSARFGDSPMAYVRQRRLVAAAERLAGQTPTSLIDLALDCGFDSQEGFTRAFKRTFGEPPGQYRRGVGEHLETVLMSVTKAPALTSSPEPVMKPALRIAGLAGRFDDSTKASIPTLWMRLVPHLPLKGQLSLETYGVSAAAPDMDGDAIRYLAGVGIAVDAPAPVGLEVIELPARPYLVFRLQIEAEGLHPQMQAAMKVIWGELAPRSGYTLAEAPDIEYYPPDFQPNRAGWVEWWIPVEV
jgi:AraC family transcriptional regulator